MMVGVDKQFSVKDVLIGMMILCAGLALFAAFVHGRITGRGAAGAWYSSGMLTGAGIGFPFHRWKTGAMLGLLLALAIVFLVVDC